MIKQNTFTKSTLLLTLTLLRKCRSRIVFHIGSNKNPFERAVFKNLQAQKLNYWPENKLSNQTPKTSDGPSGWRFF